jgi:acyl-CoA synthetase (AMP-forming)/AMP-acid ligase II
VYTVFSTFVGIATAAKQRPMLCIPANPNRDYLPEGAEFTYGEVEARVLALMTRYATAGYGHGHRALLLLENRPDYFFHFLALNGLGVSIVPVNPDYRLDEMIFQARKARVDLIVGLPGRLDELRQVANRCDRAVPVVDGAGNCSIQPPSTPPPRRDLPSAETEAGILFTSGSTGRPKGCVVSNLYMVNCARWYASTGGLTNFRYGEARHFNPLPLYHMGGLCMASMSMMVTAGCSIVPDRFQPSRFLQDAIATRASSMHYLGVVPAMLLAREPSPLDRAHTIGFAIGAGANAALIERFEARFGIPCVEGWAMTETGRAIWNATEPRHLGKSVVGRQRDGFETRVERDDGTTAAPGEPGELCVRWGGREGPRWAFFDGYFEEEAVTEEAWRGGWFHSGDIVWQEPDGSIIFVDRKKNVIRRSGENIAAAEIEHCLLGYPGVDQVAAIAVPDDIRQEEVYACVQMAPEAPRDREQAEAIFEWVNARLAYYKAPGWLLFADDLPTTGSNKIAKANIFVEGFDPRGVAGVFDFRDRKKRR